MKFQFVQPDELRLRAGFGRAVHETEGETVATFKSMVEKMFHGAATAKGALVITPEKVIVTTPGKDNKNVLA